MLAATASTVTNNLVLGTPSFSFDFAGVRLDDIGDLNPFDAAEIVAQSRVTDALFALYRRVGAPPAVAFGCEAGHLRVLSASARLAGYRAAHLDDSATVESCHQQVAELIAGRLDILVNVRRLAGHSAIPGLRAVILARPTHDPDLHERFIGRLDRTAGAVIIDMVGNCGRLGLWQGADPTVVVGEHVDVVRDPFIAKLTEVPHKHALLWAEGNIERIEMVQKARGHRPGWAYHVIQASCGKPAAERWWNERRRKSGNTQ
jgi:hypothetical protein